MVGTGEPVGQGGIFSNDLGTMLDPNQPIYRLFPREDCPQAFDGDPAAISERGQSTRPVPPGQFGQLNPQRVGLNRRSVVNPDDLVEDARRKSLEPGTVIARSPRRSRPAWPGPVDSRYSWSCSTPSGRLHRHQPVSDDGWCARGLIGGPGSLSCRQGGEHRQALPQVVTTADRAPHRSRH